MYNSNLSDSSSTNQSERIIPAEETSLLGEPPKELNVFPWPIADKAIFTGFAGEFVQFATEYSEADPMAVLVTFLARFGVEVGRNPFIAAGERQHARINAVLVGQSSKARKGTSSIPVRELFKLPEEDWKVAQVSPGPLSSGEGLIFAVRDERIEYVVNKHNGSGKDIVIDPGIEDKRLFVLDQEFAGALSCSKRDGNTLSTIIRALYDGHKVEPLTKSSKITATDPHLSIVTYITTHELSSKMDTVEAFNGFANRFLWLYALLDSSSQITTAHSRSALALWDYCEQSTNFIFGEVDADSTERRIVDALQESDGLDTRALYNIFSRNITKSKLEQALSALIANSRIRVEKQKTGSRGRPRNIFYLYEKNELKEQNTLS